MHLKIKQTSKISPKIDEYKVLQGNAICSLIKRIPNRVLMLPLALISQGNTMHSLGGKLFCVSCGVLLLGVICETMENKLFIF